MRPFLNPWLSSDHSKVYLVDGTHAWLGGMNIGRECRCKSHDLMVELTGPVVTPLEDEFDRQWAHEGPLGRPLLTQSPCSVDISFALPRKAAPLAACRT